MLLIIFIVRKQIADKGSSPPLPLLEGLFRGENILGERFYLGK